MILTSKTGFYRSRSLVKREAKRSSVPLLWQVRVGAYVVDDDWLVGEDVVEFCGHVEDGGGT